MTWYDTVQDFIYAYGGKFSVALGAVIVYLGTEIEPRAGVWVVAFGGSFMSIAMGKDRAFGAAFARLAIGIGFGIASASILDWWIHMPKIPIAFLFSLMGVELFYAIKASIRDGSIFERLVAVVSRRSPK